MSWLTKGLGACLEIASAHTFAKQDNECTFHAVSTDEVLALINNSRSASIKKQPLGCLRVVLDVVIDHYAIA